MARNTQKRVLKAVSLPTLPELPIEPKKAVEATESAIAGIYAFNADEGKPIVQPPDPNAIMFDEYGIDGSTYDIPIILKAILCELVRRRV